MVTYTFTLAVQGELTIFNPQPQERLEELSWVIQQLVQDRFRNINLETPIAIHVGQARAGETSLRLSLFPQS